jgi:uncharacterized protein YidB (DUF937 family)
MCGALRQLALPGPKIIHALAEKTGMSEQELTAHLSQILPGVIDKLTPNGHLPSQSELVDSK